MEVLGEDGLVSTDTIISLAATFLVGIVGVVIGVKVTRDATRKTTTDLEKITQAQRTQGDLLTRSVSILASGLEAAGYLDPLYDEAGQLIGVRKKASETITLTGNESAEVQESLVASDTATLTAEESVKVEKFES